MLNNQIKGLAHIGIPTQDLAKTVAFYQQLGFTLGEQKSVPHPNGMTEIVFMSAGNAVIEFYQQPHTNTAQQAGAIDHFAVEVNSMSLTLEQLAKLGIAVLVPPTLAPFGQHGVQYIIIEGPNKEKIEFDYFL